MKKCKNTECEKLIDDKRTYCSLSCRNIFVNKNMRDYQKVGEILHNKSLDNYELSPKFCKNLSCGEKIPYDKRKNNYCNSSCSATAVNNNRIYTWGKKISDGIKKSLKEKNKNIISEQEKKCPVCNNFFTGRNKYCSSNCVKKNKRKNWDEFYEYKMNCKFTFNLKDFKDEFDFSLIEKHGWYKPKNKGDNLTGVSRDHMLSIVEGFNKKISYNIINHPANCKLMIHTDNKNSSITLEELLIRIKNWDIKYGGWDCNGVVT